MTLRLILKQLEMLYGKPDTMLLFQNNTLFRSPFPATEAPEMLFYGIEQCQEIQMIAQDPYTPKQIINNAICLLMQLGVFPLKKFDTWESMPIKLYPILKTFIHEAYSRRLMAMQLQNTVGQQGYIQQNMYNILDVNGGEDTDDNTVVTVQTAAAVTATAGGSTIGSNYAAMSATTITAEVTAAINQLSANQQQIIQQMGAMKVNSPQQSIAANTYNIPPIPMVNIPNQYAFNKGGFQWG